MCSAFPSLRLLLNDQSHFSSKRNFLQWQQPKHSLNQFQLMLTIKKFVLSNNQADWVIF